MIHAAPMHDFRPHLAETSCWCGTFVDWSEAEALVTHEAADPRCYGTRDPDFLWGVFTGYEDGEELTV